MWYFLDSSERPTKLEGCPVPKDFTLSYALARWQPSSFASDQWGLPKLGTEGALLLHFFVATRERC